MMTWLTNPEKVVEWIPFSPSFSFFKHPVSNTVPFKDITLIEVYNYLRSNYAKEQTAYLRSLTDKTQISRFKAANFDYVTFGGTFTHRSNADIKFPSDLLCLDFDHVSNVPMFKEMFFRDKELTTALLFISPSGHGIKWVVPSIPTNSATKTSFGLFQITLRPHMVFSLTRNAKTLPERASCRMTPPPTSIPNTSLTMLNYYNFYNKWLKPQQPQSVPSAGTDARGDIEEVAQRIEAAGIDITTDYGDWVKLGFALSEELGEQGRSIYHRLSRFYPGYKYEECDKQYNHCLRSKGSGVTIRSFFQLAKEHGVSVSVPSIPSQASLPSRASSGETQENLHDGSDGNDENDGKIQMPTFYAKVKGRLPHFLETIAQVNDSDADADMLILGSLAVISACLPNISGIYAKLKIYPNLYLFVTARAGSGKGRLCLCKTLVDPIHEELRTLSNQ